MLKFIFKYPRLLTFGILTAMFTGPGQTFLVSLFIPHMQESMGLTQTSISSYYAIATLLSACLLPVLGHLLDRVHLMKFTLSAGALLALGCLVLSQTHHVITMILGFFLIRNLGQGTLSMVSSTTMARVFGEMRGKALGIANMGYPLSESIMPFLVSTMILWQGWRAGWIFLSVMIAVIFSPLVYLLLTGNPHHKTRQEIEASQTLEKELSKAFHATEHWPLKRVLTDKRFYILVFPALIPPLYLTALFFHQVSLISMKGWDIQIVTLGFMAFGISRAPVSFIIGPYIDRYSAKRLYFLTLIPMALGLLCFMWGQHVLWVFPYLALAGTSMGLGMTISGALWAELYGTKYLGSIRGLMTALMVFSTAAAPLIMGMLLDQGIALAAILLGMFYLCLLGIVCAFAGTK